MKNIRSSLRWITVTAVLRSVNTALEAGSHRAADRLTGECVFKKRSFLSNCIKIRCYGQFLTVATCAVSSLLVGKIKNYVWLFHLITS